ncbi:lysophospholipase [Neolewinella aurantiaca]|uniref:Lysophospholipase n=1 Tax=Neolewinella aurantiaca TaxID=2602767 RepID=A0A5C7FKC8_9BACT|nr:alpha/beta hydrolase [Neolewinella aurantiaca]TXF90396.1 lysophospholipase [Neolewinella aurantiaca]
MQAAEFSWKNDNGNQIYAVEWPVPQARAVIGLVHGVGEHCRRYDEMAAWYNAHGIAMVGYDRQGYGRSEGRKGYAENYKEYIDEIAHLLIECERRYPDLPVFLYGHSMGGHLLLRYLIRRHPNISGAVVSAPHIRLSFQPNPVLVGIGKILRNLYPTFTQENKLDTNMLSRTPGVKATYEADPYVHAKITSRTGIDILENADELNQYDEGIDVPVLLMHGEADGLTSHDGSKDFAARNPEGLTFKSWPELYHELHNEPEREDVFRYVLSWLEENMDAVYRVPKSV